MYHQHNTHHSKDQYIPICLQYNSDLDVDCSVCSLVDPIPAQVLIIFVNQDTQLLYTRIYIERCCPWFLWVVFYTMVRPCLIPNYSSYRLQHLYYHNYNHDHHNHYNYISSSWINKQITYIAFIFKTVLFAYLYILILFK